MLEEHSWVAAWSAAYDRDTGSRRGNAFRRHGAARWVALAGCGLAMVAAPLAVAGSGSAPGGEARASATGDALREGVRNPRRGAASRETQVISRVTGNRFGTRQSNTSTGSNAGGAAVYGCRRDDRECTRHVNLRAGPAAHFATAGSVPFTIDENATGMVPGLNAERVGGLTAEQLRGQPGPPGPAGAAGPPGPPGDDASIEGVPAGGDLEGSFPEPRLAEETVGSEHIGPVTTVHRDVTVIAGSLTTTAIACPDDGILLTGGHGFNVDDVLMRRSRPNPGLQNWGVTIRNLNQTQPRTVRIYARCLVPTAVG